MAQKRRWNYLDDDATKDLNRWLTGIINPGLYFGFDFNPTANMNLNLIHSTTGFKDVDDLEVESGFQSLLVTRQGTVIKEDAAITINSIANGDATHPRIDIVVVTHTYSELSGGTQALYSIIQGTPAASPVAPALANALTQTKIGELLIPANTTALNQGGVTWTRNIVLGTIGAFTGAVTTVLTSNLTADRVAVSNGAGKFAASTILTTELNQLVGIGGTPIATQLAGKQATITGAITTVLSSDLTANRAVVSNGAGKVIASSILDTEINQLAGIGGTTIATQLAGKQATITGAITTVLTSDLTANRAAVSNGAGKLIASSILDTEINQLAGIGGTTIATQLAGKQNTITGAITTVLTSDLTANRVIVSNGSGKVIVSSILDTELNQLAGSVGPVVSVPNGHVKVLCKIVPIIDWDFTASATHSVNHGLTDANIISVMGYVRPDDLATPFFQLGNITNQSPDQNGIYITGWSSGSVQLRISATFVPGGFFDSTGGYERGKLLIFYF
jgi:hypothetical protein